MGMVQKEDVEGTKRGATAPKIGDILMEEGLITEAQFQEAANKQAKLKTYKPVGKYWWK